MTNLRRVSVLLGAMICALVLAPRAAQQEAPEYGPAKGTLVIIGGNMQDGSGIAQKFIQLADRRHEVSDLMHLHSGFLSTH